MAVESAPCHGRVGATAIADGLPPQPPDTRSGLLLLVLPSGGGGWQTPCEPAQPAAWSNHLPASRLRRLAGRSPRQRRAALSGTPCCSSTPGPVELELAASSSSRCVAAGARRRVFQVPLTITLHSAAAAARPPPKAYISLPGPAVPPC
jgi:hypothetical protein